IAHRGIAEPAEPSTEGKVGSSTMPHKRNPSTAEAIVAVGRALRHTVALMHDALLQEHERDASAWRFEWKAVPEACLMTGAILAQIKDVLGGLEVHADKMRGNLDALGGFLLSERVMFALADKLGKQSAHEVVYEAAMRGYAQNLTFEQALLQHPQAKAALTAEEVAALLDPTTYVGLAPAIVDGVLAETPAAGWIGPMPCASYMPLRPNQMPTSAASAARPDRLPSVGLRPFGRRSDQQLQMVHEGLAHGAGVGGARPGLHRKLD